MNNIMTNPRGMNLIIGPQTLVTLLKTITVIKDVHTVHSLKRPRHSNIRGVDRCSQLSDLPTISSLATPLEFEPVTLTLIPLVEPQTLPTLLKQLLSGNTHTLTL